VSEGEHPFAALVRERGGVVLDGADRLGEPAPPGARFVALLSRAEEISPPLARVAEGEVPAFLVTAGRVGGGEDEPRSRPITADLVGRVLDAALAGDVDWERDPDFGFELPMALPGLEPDELLTLVPRFLYARTDRVYEYAAMVPEARAAG
jgi:ATP-dependent phosphoenolpyruvate carboxykinase